MRTFISGTNRLTCATPHTWKSRVPSRTISRPSRIPPSAFAWWTWTSTWPLVASATSCLNFSAPRPKAWSFDTGDESLRMYFGCAVALATNAASTRTTARVSLPCLIARLLLGCAGWAAGYYVRWSRRNTVLVGERQRDVSTAADGPGDSGSAVRTARGGLRLEGALELRAQALQFFGVETHAEVEAHLAQDGLDLVQRLLAEVLRLEQLALALLHEVGDRPDVRRLQAIGGAHGELQLVDVAEEVLVERGPRPGLVALGLFRLGRGVGEGAQQLEVIVEDPRGLAHRQARRHAPVRPQLEVEPLAVAGRGLDVEVHPFDGGEVGVEQDGVDGQRLWFAPLGRHIAAAALDAHLHLQHAVLVEGGQGNVGRENLDVGVGLEVARLGHPDPLGLEAEDLRTIEVEAEDNLAQVHQDVERVLHHAGQVRALVQDVLDLNPRGRGAVDGREEHAPVGVPDGHGQAGLEGLDGQLAVGVLVDRPVVAGGKLQLQHDNPLRKFRGSRPDAPV